MADGCPRTGPGPDAAGRLYTVVKLAGARRDGWDGRAARIDEEDAV